ncbi:NUDIX hydrolase [Corynebacterium felinum]|uniref:ADP-ribose pyrophosphatase n=1 Tax=Corynebacterium felinum TaxID=131318 RepID=A0ABU2BA80_9CORY|nr:NUDIX hydrolase [Corynebacterium felinum]MDF5819731.1 NUDIX hydrolase [Corynebacterium felinum]MDR7355550.1 ADP-ribose pyrophosphatase [Corynebacterium felinum]WJY94900.1 ADP-ribose pyrophosphatase [Corynebacterium felinum]
MGAHDFQVVSSELLHDAPILALRRDEVVMPGGSIASREVVEHFGAVAVVAFDGEKIALVRQYRRACGLRLWELPAGLLDFANEPELTCAQRELEEEAGVQAQQWSVLCDLITSPGFCDEAVRVFLAQDLAHVAIPEASDEEADMDRTWVSLDDAVSMVLSGEIHNSIAIAGIMSAWQVIYNGHKARECAQPFAIRPTALARRRQAEGLDKDMKKRP